MVLKVTEVAETYYGPRIWAEQPGISFPYPPEFVFDIPDFPLGAGIVPVLEQVLSLPPLDAGIVAATAAAGIDIPPEIDRRDIPPLSQELPAMPVGLITDPLFTGGVMSIQTDNWIDYWDLVSQGLQPLPPVDVATPTAQIVSAEDDDVGWISDVYDVVDTSLGGWLPGGVPVGSSIPGQVFQQAPTPQAAPVVVQQGMPAMPGPVGACDNDPMKGYVLKKHCGEWRWIKPKRKRRQQLASKSDIKDLTALIGVFGNGKALQAWIATHS